METNTRLSLSGRYHELWWTGTNVMKVPASSIFRVVEGDKWGSMVGDSEGNCKAV
jgi:hypothetical protein